MKIAAGAPELEPDVGPSRPVRVVVAGAGKMGVLHAAVLSMTPGVTLAGFQDVAPGAATKRIARSATFLNSSLPE